MAEIQFGVWNIEWMNSLFEGDPPQFKAGDTKVRGPRNNNTVDDRIADVSGVINEMGLQSLVVVEGPNRVEELQLFFDRDEINGDWKCTVQQSGAQSVGLAVRTDTGVFQDPPFAQSKQAFFQHPILKRQLCHHQLHLVQFLTQILDFITARLTCSVPRQTLLACF